MRIIKIILTTWGMLFLSACISKGAIVKFNDLYSYMEVSLENQKQLVFRALLVPKSYNVVTRYIFNKNQGEHGDQYFFSLIEESGDKKPSSDIRYTAWGGIEITVPIDSFDIKKDEVFYKDPLGRYKINLGTTESWQKYLDSKKTVQ